jgi:hypothetical protein
MKKIAKQTTLAALTTIAVTASITIGATGASAISDVPCGPSDYLVVSFHNGSAGYGQECLANPGTSSYPNGTWVTRISTGNNRVQWYGDGSWQPSTPIPKNTVYTWPNHPDGVSIQEIKIL